MTRIPTILSTSPGNYDREVSVQTAIRAEFGIDLDSRFISSSVFMTDSKGALVDIRIAYRSKVITVTPKEPLSMGTTYTVTFVGDSDLADGSKEGIRSIIGDCMAGNTTLTFSTEQAEALAPPALRTPAHGSIIRQQPVFVWEEVEGASGYHFELSETNTFSSLVYPDEPRLLTETTIELQPLEDGLYYIRLQSVKDDGSKGEWSDIFQFHLTTVDEGSVSVEDAPPVDDFPMYDELDVELELIEAFPKDVAFQVDLNVKSLYFRVIGSIDISKLDNGSMKLTGTHISDDFEEESHGIVPGRTTVVNGGDGTTYIIFTPDPLIETGGE
jgi:hypothetical protein